MTKNLNGNECETGKEQYPVRAGWRQAASLHYCISRHVIHVPVG